MHNSKCEIHQVSTKKKKKVIQPKNLKAWECQNELTSAAA